MGLYAHFFFITTDFREVIVVITTDFINDFAEPGAIVSELLSLNIDKLASIICIHITFVDVVALFSFGAQNLETSDLITLKIFNRCIILFL